VLTFPTSCGTTTTVRFILLVIMELTIDLGSSGEQSGRSRTLVRRDSEDYGTARTRGGRCE
jgi:hypothetical protein